MQIGSMITTSCFIFLMTFILVCYTIQKIIYISHKKHLFDEPSEDRKVHLTKTPNLGGVAIFTVMIFISALFIPYISIQHLNYLLGAGIMLFVLGLTDDMVGVDPIKKILAQLVVAVLLVLPGGLRFTDFHGLFGLAEMSFPISIGISVLFILLVINAFNLIDGINCLAGSIGLVACLSFAFCFWRMNQPGLLFLCVAMGGCLTGFLVFNRTPAIIFMGDTGSLFLGFMVAFFAINFVDLNKFTVAGPTPVFFSAPAIVLGLLIIPVFDTLRVFAMRIANGKSPFRADRNHIHHRLLDLGLSHMQATGILVLVTCVSVSLALLLRSQNTGYVALAITAFALSLNGVLWFITVRRSVRSKVGAPATPATLVRFFVKGTKAPLLEKLEGEEIMDAVS